MLVLGVPLRLHACTHAAPLMQPVRLMRQSSSRCLPVVCCVTLCHGGREEYVDDFSTADAGGGDEEEPAGSGGLGTLLGGAGVANGAESALKKGLGGLFSKWVVWFGVA